MLRKLVALLMNYKQHKPVTLAGNPLGRPRPRRRRKDSLRQG
ncbi:MAG: hypothetical protein OJJ21_21965 [Ferrovibrio sp.]|nr:hypothetical protein [Ferrovibrio sp.]MCW0236280.1 hypothetical protein [Ferrovibrio sp.]